MGVAGHKAKRTRKWYIMNPGYSSLFVVSPNANASGAEPIYEFAAFSEVSRHAALIGKAAHKTRVEARLISAIMYVETTHGYYDAPLAVLGLNKSLLPMNINVAYWGNTFGDRDALSKPEANILAGATLIKRIQSHLPAQAPVSHIATLYNNINADRVNDYGMRVEGVYKAEPWKKDGNK
jgi:hypothetical protein